MPVMNGMEATKEIRDLEGGKDVKIIGISAHVFKDEIQNIMSVGMDSFVKKPYQFHEIYKNLNEQLGIKYTFDKAVDKAAERKLTPDMLKNIDPEILKNLKIAIKNLNNEQIDFVINQIQENDYEIGQTLLNYTKNLKYTEVYRLLNSN